MKMIKAIIRREKENDVMFALEAAGFPAATKIPVHGRGKQKGLVAEGVVYDELPKLLIMMVVNDGDVEKVCNIIMEKAKTGRPGDGKIFITPVETAYTVSSGKKEL
ncbi:P-II family nitrogen regulator [Desulfurobacterium sp.]